MSREIKVEQHSSLGALWLIGWLFSIGFLKLSFWNGALALFLWPYFLGASFSGMAPDRAAPAAVMQPDSMQE